MSASEDAGAGRPAAGRGGPPLPAAAQTPAQADPGGDPTRTAGGWLADAAHPLLVDADPARRLVDAGRLGARAAADSVSLAGLVDGVLAAADRAAAERPAEPAARLMGRLRPVMTAAVAGYQRQARSELSRRDHERDQFVTDLLTGHTDPGRLAARAQRYGIRLSGEHVVAVARGPGLDRHVMQAVDEALAARFGAGNSLTVLRDGDLVCICAGGLRGVSAELAHRLLAHLGAGGWQVGVGRPHAGVHGLTTSLQEARNTLDLAARLGFGTPVLHAADLLVFPVLLRDRDAITDLVHTVLGPLTRARGGAQPLLDTLTVLFEQQGNQTATARALHVSVRAVTYRLDRIKALTGYHPSEPTQRFTLHTAVLGAKLIGWPGPDTGVRPQG
ncbi:MAG TPA: helix-turn-helix domain-containing protein [Pilimelia sp.]|nr:helix-turn-helix domain-containing protein [Pilimelia sp.]